MRQIGMDVITALYCLTLAGMLFGGIRSYVRGPHGVEGRARQARRQIDHLFNGAHHRVAEEVARQRRHGR